MISLAAFSQRAETQINLVGGLGNQLFGYVAGKYLEQVRGHRVVFNTWHIPRGLTDHGVTVEGRNLEGKFKSIPPASHWKTPFQKNFGSKNPGWSPALARVGRGTGVNGYFQTWKYADALDENIFSRDHLISREGSSAWLQENIESAKSLKPFMLHFRRGDYKKVPDFMGLLGRDYYLKALAELREKFENPAVWVFSDEPQLARNFFKNLGDEFRFIIPPPVSDPGESLVLMTYGRGHMISNSSFAWWGAYLSPESQIVTAPTPWLRAPDDPHDLFPKNWLLIEHSWNTA